MFFLQEYQHVHLLWFKKRSFILVWKPNPLLRPVHYTHLHARADQLLLVLNQTPPTKRSYWKHLSSCDQCNLTPATMCCCSVARCMKQTRWSSADHALAQVRPRQTFTRTLSKNGRSLKPCKLHIVKTIWSYTNLLKCNCIYLIPSATLNIGVYY